jgi:hypothetical protein
VTTSDLPGGAMPATAPAATTGSSSVAAPAGSSAGAAGSSVVTPAGSSAVGPATEYIPASDYAGSFGGPASAPAPSPAASRPASSPAAPPARLGARRARLTIRRVDPWSVLKFTLLFSICMLVIGVVAVWALYVALDKLEVFSSIHKFVLELTEGGQGATKTGGFDITFKMRWFVGGAAVLGVINTVIVTALATLGAFLYNLCSEIVGGIEVVLGERD